MKREYNISKSFIDYLKSLGCVLYLPLGENDYHDYIGGHDLQWTGNGGAAWDANVGMTYIYSPSTLATMATLQSDTINAQSFASDECTSVITFKRKTTTNGKYPDWFCMGSNSMNLIPDPIYNGTSNMGVWGDDIHNSGMTFSISGRTWFQDGTIYRTDSTNTQRPSKWASYNWYIACVGNNGRSISCYFKDIMIFNKVLTLDEYNSVVGGGN